MSLLSSLRDRIIFRLQRDRSWMPGCGWDSAWLIVEYKTSALKKQVADDDDTSFIHMHI